MNLESKEEPHNETIEEFLKFDSCLIWWTSKHDCKAIHTLTQGDLKSVIPENNFYEYKDRLKVNHRTLLWEVYGWCTNSSIEIPEELFLHTQTGRFITGQNMVGIVIHKNDHINVASLEGLVTDFKLEEKII